MKYYGIEYRSNTYRYYSLYNGARGPWNSKADAVKQGEQHEKIIKELFVSVNVDKDDLK